MTKRYMFISMQKRIFAMLIIICVLITGVFARFFYVQVVSSSSLSKKAVCEWFRDLPLSALRGSILDRNGITLASSDITYDLYVRPASMENRYEMSVMLSNVLEMDREEVYEKLGKKLSEIKIKSNISYETATEITKNYMQGVYLTENSTREYAFGDFLTQLLGFTNIDGDGQIGLEYFYNDILSGVDGKLVEQTDIKGNAIKEGLSYYIPSVAGLSIKTTIDYNLQRFIENLCKKAKDNTGAESVTCIVSDPTNSDILAIGFKPSYDLNNIPRDDVSKLMELSRLTPVTDVYEPGSTFKIITGAIAMELGLTSSGDGFYCPGYRIINGVKVSCHRRTGHGSLTLARGYSVSCNCVFMDLAMRIGLDKFYEYMSKLGLSTGYGMEMKNEAKALLMNKPLVQSFDLARMGFGQAIALSPLQLINSANCIINGGTLFKPNFVKSIINFKNQTIKEYTKTKISQVFSNKTSESIKVMLKGVVENGGGKNAKVNGLSIGGKTGTAQKYENGAIAQGKYVASFLGFYPAETPKYTVLFIVDEPKGAYYGSVVSAPYAKQVFEYIAENIEKKNLENDEYKDAHAEPTIIMPELYNMSLAGAASLLTSLNLQYLTQGEGDKVIAQLQPAGTMLSERDIVLLTLG